jgi:hypothetical protein
MLPHWDVGRAVMVGQKGGGAEESRLSRVTSYGQPCPTPIRHTFLVTNEDLKTEGTLLAVCEVMVSLCWKISTFQHDHVSFQIDCRREHEKR